MMKKVLIGIVALVALVVIGLVVVASTFDVNAYKGQIQAEAEKATGRKLDLKGPMKLNIFTLTPSITVSDVTFQNASWGSRPEMVTFKTFSAEVQLLPLLSKQVKINRLVLKGADILAETTKDGTGNWVFKPKDEVQPQPAQPAPGKSAPPADIEVKRVVIEDMTLTYKDGHTGQSTTLGLDKLDLKADSPSAPLVIAMEGKFNNKPMSINGKLATVETLKAAGEKPLPLALDIKFGNSHLIGDMTVQAKGTPRVKGTLNVPVLDVKELQEASGKGGGESKGSSSSSSEAAKPAAKSDKVFSDEPLNLAVLKAAEADLDLKGDKIILEGATLEKLAGKIMLHNGKLDIDKFTVGVKGSTLAGDVMLDGSSATPKLDVAFAGRKIDVGALMQKPGQEKLIEGLADVDINLAGAGASMHQIAGSLNGKTSVVMGEGRLNNKYLRIVAGDLFKIIDPWASKEDTGKLNCVVSKFDIKQGIATSQAMVVDGSAFSVLGDGNINLGPETLALVIDAKPKNSSLLNLAVPVRVGGTLADPSFTPDPAAIAKGIIGAAGSVLGSGAGALGGGALGGVLGNVLGQPAQPKPAAAAPEADPCVKAVSGKAAQPAPAAQPSGQAAPAPKPGPAGAVEGVTKGLKGILP